MTATDPGFDIIGDVHGHADRLVELLELLGYEEIDGAWRHVVRAAIFVGDLIDRGPKQVEAVAIARSMVDAGTGRVVLGNHEFNAIAWATADPDESGAHLRAHNDKNSEQHREYLRQVGEGSDLHRHHLEWFTTLPLWLDLGDLRVVHACWSPNAMAAIAGLVDADNSLTDELVVEASRNDTEAYQAIEHLLKGPEIEIPTPYLDKQQHRRDNARYAWWLDDPGRSLRRAALLPGDATTPEGHDYPALTEAPVEPPLPVVPYADSVPVFYGHYWATGTPAATSARTACVDYSAANGGPLVAYRWQGESTVNDRNFVATGEQSRA